MLQSTPLWDRGRAKFDWWPDWRGKACAIVAPGPTAKKANLTLIRGKLLVIAIKEVAVGLCPWADVAYGCDAAWWIHRRGLPDFNGLRIGWERSIATSHCDVRLIEIKPLRPNVPGQEWVDAFLFDEPGVVGAGRNSGFQAVNLAAQFGADRILLIGFDMKGEHYYGRNNWFKAGNPDAVQFERCIRAFGSSAPTLKQMGIDVVNASPNSDLQCFRRSTIEHALSGWAL